MNSGNGREAGLSGMDLALLAAGPNNQPFDELPHPAEEARDDLAAAAAEAGKKQLERGEPGQGLALGGEIDLNGHAGPVRHALELHPPVKNDLGADLITALSSGFWE